MSEQPSRRRPGAGGRGGSDRPRTPRGPGRPGSTGRGGAREGEDLPSQRREPEEGGLRATPGGRHEPAGIERARRTQGAPPRPKSAKPPAPPRPPLPVDEEPRLPKAVRREIDRVLGKGDRARDVALALSVGGEAIDLEEPDIAIEVLAWAKQVAPRVPAVREAYGVARYLAEDWAGALTELQAYRRMTGRTDQNHLIADCLRGLDRELDRVAEVVEELLADEAAPADRRAEGVIVWASALADEGDVSSGRSLLRRFLDRPDGGNEPHVLRVRAVAAALAERDGDAAEAKRQRDLVADADPELFEELEHGADPT